MSAEPNLSGLRATMVWLNTHGSQNWSSLQRHCWRFFWGGTLC